MRNQVELRTVFTKNRTEEIGHDVWRLFVVPPFYDKLDLQDARKPRLIVGGRGSGKTMLLRYLSHQSTFSRDRHDIPPDAIAHIGLYWRADTQFAQLMRGRGQSPETWASAFEHLLAIAVGLQVLESLRSVAASSCAALQPAELEHARFDELSAYDPSLAGTYAECLATLRRLLRQFEMWAANAERVPVPTFLPGVKFLTGLIAIVREQLPTLERAIFFVYVDEYENLQEYQQRILNTHLKHSEAPLIFNVAVKRNGVVTFRTTGDESIADVMDFRQHDLEAYLAPGFDLFAAEVLLLTLSLAGVPVPVDVEILRDPGRLVERRESNYADQVLGFARAMLPSVSEAQLAADVFESPSVVRRLRKRIEQALAARSSRLSVDSFVRARHPQASLVAMALLARRQHSDTEILQELDKLEAGEDNRFTGKTDWIHNNLVGTLLLLYESEARVSRFYAGFDTYCRLAQTNLRHFLELCHRALNRLGTDADGGVAPVVPAQEQADAAREASAAFLAQVRSFGRLGNRLHTFVLRLGSLFAVAHQRPTQSEPEVNHFALARGATPLTDEDEEFLREAEKWSVLIVRESTKLKAATQAPVVDYFLNPIYAPYFNISYRKRRKLDLSIEDFQVLASGNYDQFRVILRRYMSTWAVDADELNPTLFSHLEPSA